MEYLEEKFQTPFPGQPVWLKSATVNPYEESSSTSRMSLRSSSSVIICLPSSVCIKLKPKLILSRYLLTNLLLIFSRLLPVGKISKFVFGYLTHSFFIFPFQCRKSKSTYSHINRLERLIDFYSRVLRTSKQVEQHITLIKLPYRKIKWLQRIDEPLPLIIKKVKILNIFEHLREHDILISEMLSGFLIFLVSFSIICSLSFFLSTIVPLSEYYLRVFLIIISLTDEWIVECFCLTSFGIEN